MPPLALTPRWVPTVSAINATAVTEAPPAGWKSRDGGDRQAGRRQRRRRGDQRRGDTHGIDTEVRRFVDQGDDVRAHRLGFEQGVIDERSDTLTGPGTH